GPEEILGLAEQRQFGLREDAGLDEIVAALDAVVVLADPEQGVEVAEAALAFLDVGLDEVARGALLLVALVALGKLGGDELAAGALHDLGVEAGDEFVAQRAVAPDVAGLEDGGADRHVGARQAHAFGDAAGGVADLEAEVPEEIQDELDDALAP